MISEEIANAFMSSSNSGFAQLEVKKHRYFLDKLRWISALVVALGHALAIMNYRGVAGGAWKFAADLRGPAVIIFFVLSGYLVGGPILSKMERFSFRDYAVARFSRIYIVLIPAILLTVLLDGLANYLFPGSAVYASVWPSGVFGDSAITTHYGMWNVLATVFCLEPIMAHALGSAGSLWSLGYEWIFYFAFPVLCLSGNRIAGRLGIYGMVLLSVLVTAIFSRISAAFYSTWLLGAFAANFKLTDHLRSETLVLAVKNLAFLMLLAGVLLYEGVLGHQLGMLVIGGCGFVFLACPPLWESDMEWAGDRKLADFSYSLYVIHLQIQTFVAVLLWRSGWLSASGTQSVAWSVLGTALLLLVSLVAAYGFGQAFEARTQALARWLRGQLGGGVWWGRG